MKRKSPSVVDRAHHVFDATGASCGRLAVKVSHLLRGKHKVSFAPHLDIGDFVTITNGAKIFLSGKKLIQKDYKHFSGYPGGLKRTSAKHMLVKNPSHVLRNAILNMLSDTRNRKHIMKRLVIKD